jgi:holo-[acyl-carrier protein] synthase
MNSRSIEQTARRTELGEDDALIDGGPQVFSGTDVVSIRRIAHLLEEFGASFADRAFTADERRYCDGRTYPAQHYAARWAVKESFLKVLGASSPPVPTAEIAVVREPSGPQLSLGSRAEAALSARLEAIGATVEQAKLSVSLSHDRDSGHATAHVIVVVPAMDEAVVDSARNENAATLERKR